MNKFSAFILTVIISIIWSPCFSQNILGVVIDSEGNPIELANVKMLGENNSFVTGTSTSSNGQFQLHPRNIHNGSYKLTASYVGMIPDTLQIDYTSDHSMEAKLRLKQDSKKIKEVSIVAKREIFRSKGDVLIADIENSVLSKSGTLSSLMNQIPFVTGTDDTFTVFGRGEATIYLNNRKLHNKTELKSLSSHQIKRVEVITNPTSRYSSDVKAVIKIYTTDNPDGLGGNAMLILMHGKRFSNLANATIVYNHKDVQISGGLSHSDTKAPQSAIDNSEIIPSRSITENDVDINFRGLSNNANIELNYSPPGGYNIGLNTQLRVSENQHNIHLKSIRHISNGVEDFRASADASSNGKPIQWITNAYALASWGKTRFELSNDFILGSQENLFDYQEDNSSRVNTSGLMDYLMNSSLLDVNTSIKDKLSTNYGLEFTYSTDKQSFGYAEENLVTGMSQTQNKRTQTLLGIYSNWSYMVGRWSINTGLRYEHTNQDYYVSGIHIPYQSRVYNQWLPSLNISLRASKSTNVSLGYRKVITRPTYSHLNDNIQYNSRYQYIQGNSLLQPEIVNSVNLLGSYKKLKFTGSYDWVSDAIVSGRSIYNNTQNIILSRVINLPKFSRINAGINWWDRFGFYTPYLELNIGKQLFEYDFVGTSRSYREPYFSFKIHHTFSLPKNITIMVFSDYIGSKFSTFKRLSYSWSSLISISRNLNNGWFVQLSANNLLCPTESTTNTYTGDISDSSKNINDYINISLLVSYRFNNNRKRHNTYTKTSEYRRF